MNDKKFLFIMFSILIIFSYFSKIVYCEDEFIYLFNEAEDKILILLNYIIDIEASGLEMLGYTDDINYACDLLTLSKIYYNDNLINEAKYNLINCISICDEIIMEINSLDITESRNYDYYLLGRVFVVLLFFLLLLLWLMIKRYYRKRIFEQNPKVILNES